MSIISLRRAGRVLVAAVLVAAFSLTAPPVQAAPPPPAPPPSPYSLPAGPWPPSKVLAADPATTPAPEVRLQATTSCPAVGYGVDRSAPGSGKTVALTFDDGPGASTAAILQILRSAGVPATFFNIGVNATVRPALVQDEAAQGIVLGNHTWGHPDMATQSAAVQAGEMDKATAEQISLVGSPPCVFRPPYGSYNSTTLSLAPERNMSFWTWSVDTEDWKAAGSASSYWVDRIISLAQAGGSQSHPVVLMHNAPAGNPATVAALPSIIQFYRDRGYAFVTLLSASAIDTRYASDPALRAALGAPVGAEQYGDGYAWREYERGRLYWSPSTGVHLLRGGILAAFLAAGGVPALGAPTNDESPAGGNGYYNHFSAGTSIYWSPATGAQVLRGAIRVRWLQLGSEWGLGFPTAGEVAVGPGAMKQTFTGGEIYWSAATGAHELRGAIAAAWVRGGGLGRMGLPTTNETAVPGGVRQDFSGGFTVVSSSSGAFIVGGGIRAAWLGRGGPGGVLGLPLTGETATPQPGGRYNLFTGGAVVWSPATGAVSLFGGIGARWKAAGGAESALGLPLTNEQPTPDGRGVFVPFGSGAAIYWSATTGAHIVQGAIGQRWQQLGGVRALGLPTTDELALGTGAGFCQLFERAKFLWSATTGAWPVRGGIRVTYEQLGSEWSRLGLPTSAEYAISGGWRQDFQHGQISWNAATNATTVTYT